MTYWANCLFVKFMLYTKYTTKNRVCKCHFLYVYLLLDDKRMRQRFNATQKIVPVYSYAEDDWVYCPNCSDKYDKKKKLFKALDRKQSKIRIKCKGCGDEVDVIV